MFEPIWEIKPKLFLIVQKTRLSRQAKGRNESSTTTKAPASINKVIYKFKLNKYSALDVYMKKHETFFTLIHCSLSVCCKVSFFRFFQFHFPCRGRVFRANLTTNTFSLSTFSEMVGKIDFGAWLFWRKNSRSMLRAREGKTFPPTKQNERFNVEGEQKTEARRVEAEKTSHFPPGRRTKSREGKRDSNLKQGTGNRRFAQSTTTGEKQESLNPFIGGT